MIFHRCGENGVKKLPWYAHTRIAERRGRDRDDCTYIAGEYTDYGYMGSDGVEYATIDEAIEAGAA